MWQQIQGHDAVVEQFRRSLARGRLASTFLFVGPAGIGKRTFALGLAKTLLCQTNDAAQMDPCNRCDACAQVDVGTHPDLIQIAKPADKSEMPVSVFIGEKEERMRTGLCHDIALRPFMGGCKVAIIDDADTFNEEGANCLLKTLEEPPPRSVLILIGTSADKQLPTIRSRAQIIRFQPLDTRIVAELLQTVHDIANVSEAERLAAYSEGSVERALELVDESLWKFRQQLLGALARPSIDGANVARSTLEFIDEAGKDAAPRRRRTRQVIGIATEFYRQLLRGTIGLKVDGDEELIRAVNHALRSGQLDGERIARQAERSLEAIEHVDRNANQATLVEAWLDAIRA